MAQQTPPLPPGLSLTPPAPAGGLPPLPPGLSLTPPATPAPRRAAAAPARRRNAAPVVAPAVDEASEPLIRDAQTTAEGTTYTVRPLAPGDTPESLAAEGREFNPVTNTWEFPRGLEDVEVQGSRPEMLPMVRPPAATPQGNLPEMPWEDPLNAAAAAVANAYRENPVGKHIIALAGGGARGIQRVASGAYGLLGQAADRLGLDGVGNAMIDQANALQARADAMNAPNRAANVLLNQIGQVTGEIAATAPVAGVVGRGIVAGGQGVARVAPQVGRVIERVGQATQAGGFLPSAVRPPAARAAPVFAQRLGNLAIRGTGGAVSGGTQAALIDPEDAQAGAAIGALLPTIAARPAKWALNRVLAGYEALTEQLGRTRAAEIVRQSLGVDYDVAVAALRNAAPDVTAQQALVDAGVEPSAFMGVGAAVRAADPDPYLAIEAAQRTARQAPIDRLAGGANLTDAQMAARAEKEVLRAATVPMQRAELAAADASGALDVAPVSAALMAQADAPGVRGTANSTVLANIAARLDAMADMGGGVASAQDVYALRSGGLDDIITSALSTARGGDISSQAARRSEMVRSAQRMLDEAIEEAARRAPPAATVSAADAPLTLYHGSAADFDNFDLAFMGSGEGGQGRGLGFYFSTQPEVAKYYVDKMRTVGRAGPGVEYTVAVPKGKFIDWDVPIAQQPDVMAVAPSLVGQPWLNANPDATAREFMQVVARSGANARLMGRRADQAAVAQLRERGFVGTVHSDALTQSPSLGGGQGQRNYAVFDPRDITIQAKNGVPTPAAAEAVAAPRTDGGWQRYLDAYSSGSRGIERQNMMGVAGRQLRQNPNTFTNLVAGDAPDVVSGVFGGNRIDLRNLMNPTGVGPSGMDALDSAARQIRRDERIGVLANEGRGVARELLQQPGRGPMRRLFNFMSRAKPVTAAAMEFGSMLVDAKVAPQIRRALAQAYQSGANMDELLAMVPLATRAQMARNMMNPSFWSHLTGAATNVMADPPSNAMSPPAQ